VFHETIGVSWCEAEVAPVETREGRTAAQRVHPSPRDGGHRPFLRHQTATQPVDDERLSGRREFRMIGIRNPGDIASELDNRILKSGARSEERLP
jgi:hypothetical protein